MVKKKVSKRKTNKSKSPRKKQLQTTPKSALNKPKLEETPQDKWTWLKRNYQRCVDLGGFFDVAKPPRISDVEIVVCFSDIRGFTEYCKILQEASLDTRIQNFLKAFLQIYPLGVLEAIWRLEHSDPKATLSDDETQVRDILIPETYKNLGDGMMLVWEIPSSTTEEVQGRVAHHILGLVSFLYRRFDEFFRNPSPVGLDAYGKEVKDLRIGFGVARGHAWKLDFGHHLKPDYAGSIVNLAARLEDKARPEGLVCQYELSQSLFDGLTKKNVGHIVNMTKVKGIGKQKAIVLDRDNLKNRWLFGDAWVGWLKLK